MAYKYEGFWRAMDTLRDRQVLEEMIETRRCALAAIPPAQAAVGNEGVATSWRP